MIVSLIMAGAEAAVHTPDMGGVSFFYLLRCLLVVASILTGLFFVLAGTFGVLRLPDFYTRMHAAGMTDTLGAELILLGLIIQSGYTQTSAKLLLVAFFLLMTSPTATHAVANAAYQAGLKPLLGKYRAPSPNAASEPEDDH